MKKQLAIWTMIVMVLFAPSFLWAEGGEDSTGGDINIGIENDTTVTATGGDATAIQDQNQDQNQRQGQRQDQYLINNSPSSADADANASSSSSSSANNKMVNSGNSQLIFNEAADLVEAETHAIDLPGNLSSDHYGRPSTLFSLKATTGLFCGMTLQQLNAMIAYNNKEGYKSWKKINGNVKFDPFIRHQFSALGSNDSVYALSGEAGFQLLRKVRMNHIAGWGFYDVDNLNKNSIVLGPHLQLRAQLDASSVGANVVVLFDQFDRRSFFNNSSELDAGGVWSFISRAFTGGGSLAGSAGMANGQGTMFVSPGIAVVFLRVEGLSDEICYDKQEKVVTTVSSFEERKVVAAQPATCNPDQIWLDIEELKRKIAKCNYFGINNLRLRAALGEKYIELAVCTGDAKYFNLAVTDGFEVAERNFRNGKDIGSHRAEAEKIMQRVHYLQAGCLYQIYGLENALAFASEHGLEKFPRSFGN